MSAGADLRPGEQNPRHCFADISIDHREFWRWYYRDELRGQDAPTSLPVVDPDVAAKGFCARVRYEVSRETRKLFGKILRHVFLAQFLVAKTAKGNCGKNSVEVASGIASHPTKYGVPSRNSFATVRRA